MQIFYSYTFKYHKVNDTNACRRKQPTFCPLTQFHRIGQIIRCQSDGNYTNFYFADGSTLLVSKTLNDFEEILQGYGFIRTHKAHLVNLMFVSAFHKNDGGYLKMTDGTSVPVSRRRKEEILERFKRM